MSTAHVLLKSLVNIPDCLTVGSASTYQCTVEALAFNVEVDGALMPEAAEHTDGGLCRGPDRGSCAYCGPAPLQKQRSTEFAEGVCRACRHSKLSRTRNLTQIVITDRQWNKNYVRGVAYSWLPTGQDSAKRCNCSGCVRLTAVQVRTRWQAVCLVKIK